MVTARSKIKASIHCLYTKYFFEQTFAAMKANEQNFILDPSGTVWHIEDVETILIVNHGYRKAASGGIV